MPRIVMPGWPHHVTQKTARSLKLFKGDQDRFDYLAALQKAGERCGISFLSYCLMTNHVHLIAVPAKEDSLSVGVGAAHWKYSRIFNDRHHGRGTLFQGRFYSCPMDERHLFAAVRYVERNPVNAGMVKNAWDYLWSSARFRVGLENTDTLIRKDGFVGHGVGWRSLLAEELESTPNFEVASIRGLPVCEKNAQTAIANATGKRVTRKFLRNLKK